jgi:hypothetical protein
MSTASPNFEHTDGPCGHSQFYAVICSNQITILIDRRVQLAYTCGGGVDWVPGVIACDTLYAKIKDWCHASQCYDDTPALVEKRSRAPGMQISVGDMSFPSTSAYASFVCKPTSKVYQWCLPHTSSKNQEQHRSMQCSRQGSPTSPDYAAARPATSPYVPASSHPDRQNEP